MRWVLVGGVRRYSSLHSFILATMVCASANARADDSALVNVEFGFPKTPHKRVVDTCAELWGHLGFLCGDTTTLRSDVRRRDTAMMLALGSAAYLHAIIESHARSFSNDDQEHMNHMLERTMMQCQQPPEWTKDDDRFSLVQKWLREVREQVNDGSLKGNDAVFRSGK